MALNFRRRTTDAPAIVHLQLEMINGGTILAISSKWSRDHDSFWKYIIKMNRQKYEWLLLFLIRSVSKGKMHTNPAPWIEQSVRCFMGDERRARAHSRLRSRYYLAIVQNREGYNLCREWLFLCATDECVDCWVDLPNWIGSLKGNNIQRQ